MKAHNKKQSTLFSLTVYQGKGITRFAIIGAILLLAIIAVLSLSGCKDEPVGDYIFTLSESSIVYVEAPDRDVDVSVNVNEEASFAESNVKGGDVSVEKSLVSENAYFYTYITKNDVKMQIIFVLAPNGSLRVGLNTSEECKGEPDAYYIQGEGIFKCAHCGHVVANGEVGLGTNTAAPLGISYEENNGNILINESDLLAYESYFTDWKGPTE